MADQVTLLDDHAFLRLVADEILVRRGRRTHVPADGPGRAAPAVRRDVDDWTNAVNTVSAATDPQARRFEFTLLLSALHSRLDFMTTLWPRVEAALKPRA